MSGTTSTSTDSARVVAAAQRAVARAAEYRRLNPGFRYSQSAECKSILRRTLRRHEISAAEAADLLGAK